MISHPPFLVPGSVVGITCPAGYVAPERVLPAVSILESWGFGVRLGNTIGTGHHYFSGTDEQRLADLQQMLDDPGLDAILMGRGGYGVSRIIDRLDFTRFINRPSWICGFSDITVLHSHLESRYGIPSLHSPMCGAFTPETEASTHVHSFRAALTGQSVMYHPGPSPFNRQGSVSAPLTGGNLALLTHLLGSPSEVDTSGKILFIEDVGEHLYKIDRMMLSLKRAGKLSHLAGLLVGGFTELDDTERPFGQSVGEIIREKVEEYQYPVCFNFPAGHQPENHTLVLGAVHKLAVTANGAILELRR